MYLESSLSSSSVCSSKSIKHAVGKAVIVDMIVFDNLEELITQGYRCLIRMAYRSKSVTRPRLIDQSTGKEKRKKSF